MNTKLKAQIESAIEEALDKNSEAELWDGYIDDGLVKRMTEAAELVFDSSMAAQKFALQERA